MGAVNSTLNVADPSPISGCSIMNRMGPEHVASSTFTSVESGEVAVAPPSSKHNCSPARSSMSSPVSETLPSAPKLIGSASSPAPPLATSTCVPPPTSRRKPMSSNCSAGTGCASGTSSSSSSTSRSESPVMGKGLDRKMFTRPSSLTGLIATLMVNNSCGGGGGENMISGLAAISSSVQISRTSSEGGMPQLQSNTKSGAGAKADSTMHSWSSPPIAMEAPVTERAIVGSRFAGMEPPTIEIARMVVSMKSSPVCDSDTWKPFSVRILPGSSSSCSSSSTSLPSSKIRLNWKPWMGTVLYINTVATSVLPIVTTGVVASSTWELSGAGLGRATVSKRVLPMLLRLTLLLLLS
mmetsp:Transcript_2763/g.10064  ORF Transcript_2763/g.10064 Transcript_2763/m.10064 type:complete len:353 (-) Transcript_2763:286-1344(-)